jgi:hypothetical protein
MSRLRFLLYFALGDKCCARALPETYNENGPVVFLRVLIVPNPERDNAERHFSAPVKAAGLFHG